MENLNMKSRTLATIAELIDGDFSFTVKKGLDKKYSIIVKDMYGTDCGMGQAQSFIKAISRAAEAAWENTDPFDDGSHDWDMPDSMR